MIIRGCQTWAFSPDTPETPATFWFPEWTGKFGGNAFCAAGKVVRPPVLSCLSPSQRTLKRIVRYVVFLIASTAMLLGSSLLTFAP